jgi:hypothetical protein
MAKGKAVPEQCSMTKTLLKTVTQTINLAAGSSSATYVLVAAKEITKRYLGLLFEVEYSTQDTSGTYKFGASISSDSGMNSSFGISSNINGGSIYWGQSGAYYSPSSTAFSLDTTNPIYWKVNTSSSATYNGTVTIKVYGIDLI